MQELWTPVRGFEWYEVSREGLIRNFSTQKLLKPYPLPDGSMGVKLQIGGKQSQQLVRRIVADAYCPKPTENSDSVIQKDYVKSNCAASNLAWRPRWFAWRYYRQSQEPIKQDWQIRPIRNRITNVLHANVVDAGLYDGTLWFDIYRSAQQRTWAFPGMQYEFMDLTWERVDRIEAGL